MIIKYELAAIIRGAIKLHWQQKFNKRLLHILIAVVTIMFLVWLLFIALKYPGMFFGIYRVPVLNLVGLIIFLIKVQNGKS